MSIMLYFALYGVLGGFVYIRTMITENALIRRSVRLCGVPGMVETVGAFGGLLSFCQ